MWRGSERQEQTQKSYKHTSTRGSALGGLAGENFGSRGVQENFPARRGGVNGGSRAKKSGFILIFRPLGGGSEIFGR